VAKRCLLPRCGSVRVKDRWRTELFFSNRRTENNGQKIKRVGRRLMRGGAKRRGSHQGDPREFSSARENNPKRL